MENHDLDDNDRHSENDESPDEDDDRWSVQKTKLLLEAYRKFKGKLMSGRQKKKIIWAKVCGFKKSVHLLLVAIAILLSHIYRSQNIWKIKDT